MGEQSIRGARDPGAAAHHLNAQENHRAGGQTGGGQTGSSEWAPGDTASPGEAPGIGVGMCGLPPPAASHNHGALLPAEDRNSLRCTGPTDIHK